MPPLTASPPTPGPEPGPLFEIPIGDAFDATVSRHGDREALVVRHQGLRYSWAELGAEVERHARALMALGLTAGDRIGIWSPNCAEWCIAQFATAKIGAILVNINPAYRLEDLRYALNQSGCQWLICADTFKTSDYHRMVLDLVPSWPAPNRAGSMIRARRNCAARSAWRTSHRRAFCPGGGSTSTPNGCPPTPCANVRTG